MLNEICGLFEDRGRNTKFEINIKKFYGDEHKQALRILCDSINKNKEVAGLLNLIDGDSWTNGKPYYSTKNIFCMLCFTRQLLNNLLWFVDTNIKKEGVLSRTIFNGIISAGEVKKRIEKLPSGATAEDALSCFKIGGIYFYDNIFKKCRLHKIYIANDKIRRIICVLEKVDSDSGTYEIIQGAIKEIDEVMNTMINGNSIHYGGSNITYHICSDDYFEEFKDKVKEEVKEAAAMADNTQTLTLNRPKQQENKIITVGNKKAYQVGKGDYQHRNGIIKEEKAEMNKVYTYPVGDKNILADLEDLLNNIIDNPDTVDNLVNYLEKNAPAAHFISEMIGCGEVDSEESLIGAFNKATSLSQGMIAAGKNVRVQGGEYKVYNYLNVDYPKPIFGREFSLKQLSFCFDVAAREIEDIFVKAKAEEEAEEEKEEAISNDAVQNYAGYSVEELEKLLEERDKEEAEVDAEIKQAEEEARRKELVEQLLAKDKRIAEKKALRDKLREK